MATTIPGSTLVPDDKVFQLADVRVSVVADRGAVLAAATQYLEDRSFEPRGGSADVHFDLRSPGEVQQRAGDLVTPKDSTLEVYRDGARYVVAHRSAELEVDPALGRTRARRLPDDEALAADGLGDLSMALSMALFMMVRWRGYFGIHAVGLVRDGGGVLLVGPSDSGKSTTALALVRLGWGFLSDDSLLLRRADSGVVAYGVRRDFCVDAGADAHFPELAERSWPRQAADPDKWKVDIGALYGAPRFGSCVPAVIAFPRVVASAASRLEPIARTEAFGLVCKQSAVALYGQDGCTQRHFEVLTQLLRQCSTYRLALGRDVLNEPERFDRLLASAVDASGSLAKPAEPT